MIILLFLPFVFIIISIIVQYKDAHSMHCEEDDTIVMRMSPSYYFLGYFLIAFSFALSLLCWFGNSPIGVYAFSGVSLASFLYAIGLNGYRVEFNKNELYYRSYFWKAKIINYSSIVDVEFGLSITLNTEDDIIHISEKMDHFLEFKSFIKKKRQRKEKKRIITYPPVRKLRDAVYRHKEIIAAFVMEVLVAIYIEALTLYGYFTVGYLNGSKIALYRTLLISFITLVVVPLYIALGISAIKRAHSSKKWYSFARFFLLNRSYYLKG